MRYAPMSPFDSNDPLNLAYCKRLCEGILNNPKRIVQVCMQYGYDAENYKAYLRDQIALMEWDGISV